MSLALKGQHRIEALVTRKRQPQSFVLPATQMHGLMLLLSGLAHDPKMVHTFQVVQHGYQTVCLIVVRDI